MGGVVRTVDAGKRISLRPASGIRTLSGGSFLRREHWRNGNGHVHRHKRPVTPKPLWERACSRWRTHIQHEYQHAPHSRASSQPRLCRAEWLCSLPDNDFAYALQQPRNLTPCTGGTMRLIVRPSPQWRFRFGDLIIENAKAFSLIAGANAPAKPLSMAAVRGRSSGLPVFLCAGSPTCVQLPPNRLATTE